MCEREETDLGEREETALELEEVSESEIDLVPATGFFALSALELLSTVDASTPRGDDAPFHPGKRQPSPGPSPGRSPSSNPNPSPDPNPNPSRAHYHPTPTWPELTVASAA